MNLSSLLSIGSNGLNAASQGTQVASQNISNATTPGYTRRIVNQEPNPLALGGGVRTKASTRAADQFLEKRGLAARTTNGEADGRVKTLAVMDTVFGDGQGSVGEALDAFDSGLNDLTASPNSTAVRQTVLSHGTELVESFHRAADALSTARSEANSRVVDAVDAANQQIDQIGVLNKKIVQGKNTGADMGDLEDQRDQLIRGLAEEMPITVLPDDSGAVTVTMGGTRTLVGIDSKVHHLLASTDTTTGTVRIQRQTNGELEDITGLFNTGSIGGTIAARDGALADAQVSLDQLAYDVSTAYNTQHALGVGLDGNTGRNMFAAPTAVAGAAANFALSSDIAGQPANLGAAQDANSLPGDNRNALALVGLHDQRFAQGGTTTAQQAFSAMVAAGGAASRSAQDQAEYASATLSQVESMRESASGVSTDEEMMSMMKYQRAYQASLRVIETADSMLSELLNMRRG
jgi:flagellar hook-associated protein 1 FlgK